MPNQFILEGLDRLGKSSLVEGIRNKRGYFEVLHYSKPAVLDHYYSVCSSNGDPVEAKRNALFAYQRDCFRAMFDLLSSKAHLILDRAHLGEMVYAPLYRGYSGDYVLDLERIHRVDCLSTRLILLTEDFEKSQHFVDDGLSLGSADKRRQEQDMFISAFNKSSFSDKRIVCVTDKETGKFRSKEDILAEVLGDD